jgi:secondary thiamine-phosphate synthase enzyme
MIFNREITINSKDKFELITLTERIRELVQASKIKEGFCMIYVPHATASIIVNESADPNIKLDFLKVLNKLVPEHDDYKHDNIDANAQAHIKASIIGPGEVIPINDHKLMLGMWQSIMFCEFDGPRERNILVKVYGES